MPQDKLKTQKEIFDELFNNYNAYDRLVTLNSFNRERQEAIKECKRLINIFYGNKHILGECNKHCIYDEHNGRFLALKEFFNITDKELK